MVTRAAEEAFPALVDLLMEAGNAAQAQALEETRFQVSLKMVLSAERKVAADKALAAQLKACRTTDEIWNQVVAEAKRHSPKIQNEIEDLKTYVMHQAGNEGSLIKEIVAFQKSLKKPKTIRGDVLATIALLTLGEDGHSCIDFRQDMIKACIGAGLKYSSGDEQTLLESNTLKSACRTSAVQKMIIMADKMKSVATGLVNSIAHKELELHGDRIGAAMDLFGVRMVHYVFKKPDPARQVHSSLHAIGRDFCKDVADLIGKEFASPWHDKKPDGNKKGEPAQGEPGQGKPAQGEPAQGPNAPELKKWSDSTTVDRMRLFDEANLKVGAVVKDMKGKCKLKVKSIDPNDKVVVIRKDEDGEEEELEFAAAVVLKHLKLSEWRVLTIDSASREGKVLENWGQLANPTLSFEWKSMIAQARVALALDELATKSRNSELGARLHIVVGGTGSGVYATVDIKANSLVLVPLTTSVQFRAKVGESGLALPQTLLSVSGDKLTLSLMKPHKAESKERLLDTASQGVHEEKGRHGFVPHFWFVKDADDPKEANLVVDKRTDLKIPCLCNTRAIMQGEELLKRMSCKRATSSTTSGPVAKSTRT